MTISAELISDVLNARVEVGHPLTLVEMAELSEAIRRLRIAPELEPEVRHLVKIANT